MEVWSEEKQRGILRNLEINEYLHERKKLQGNTTKNTVNIYISDYIRKSGQLWLLWVFVESLRTSKKIDKFLRSFEKLSRIINYYKEPHPVQYIHSGPSKNILGVPSSIW